MKILYLSQLVPYPPDAGPKVRSYYTLRYLAQKHEVTLLAFTRPDDTPEAIEHLRTFCHAVHTVPLARSRSRDGRALLASLLGGHPFVIQRDSSPEMDQRIQSEIQNSQYDFIHADQLWMAQFVDRLDIRSMANAKPKTVLDAHNATFQIFHRLAQGEHNPLKRLVLEREWRTLLKYEARICRQFDHVITVTEEDRMMLESLNPAKSERPAHKIGPVIPICIDIETLQMVKQQAGSQDVLHMGTMFWMPNVEGVEWFIREAWPLVRQRVPRASFTIVGKRPPESLRRLAELDGAIRVTGYVADPTPYLESCVAFIVPLHSGSGMRVKIVESWGRGLPVVSTTVGAEGLQYRDGENILLADGGQAFGEAVCRLLTDKALNQQLRQNGRHWAEEYYDWRKIYQTWDEIYRTNRM